MVDVVAVAVDIEQLARPILNLMRSLILQLAVVPRRYDAQHLVSLVNIVVLVLEGGRILCEIGIIPIRKCPLRTFCQGLATFVPAKLVSFIQIEQFVHMLIALRCLCFEFLKFTGIAVHSEKVRVPSDEVDVGRVLGLLVIQHPDSSIPG